MKTLPDLDWANLQLDWDIPTHSFTLEELRRMTGEQRFAIGCKLTDEGRRRWREALRRRFPGATPGQMREIILRILLAEAERENAIAERVRAYHANRGRVEC